VVINPGGLIEIADYNALALEINRLYSDNTIGLNYNSSNIILNATALPGGNLAGSVWSLSEIVSQGDFVVATINGITIKENIDFILSYTTINPTITILDPIPPSAQILVWNRTTHRFGWGQQASVYPISAGDPILADESVLQAYIEANVNNIIDKVNIIEERIDGPSLLTRVAPGNLVRAQDKTTILSAINNDVLTNNNYWKNENSTVFSDVAFFERNTPWNNILIGEMRYTWDSYNEFRYFFNSGNEIRAFITMAGDPLEQGFNNWNQVVSRMGTLVFKYSTATQTGNGGFSENLGVYELSFLYQRIFTSGSPLTPVNSVGMADEYVSYTDLIMEWDSRIILNTPGPGQVTVDIRLTMDDNNLNLVTIGTTRFNAGYSLANPVVDNSASFSVNNFVPTITVGNSFTTGDDS
jgi:hypothetical protein